MALSAFDDKAHQPTDEELKQKLGRSDAHWTGLCEHLAEQFAPLDQQWGFSGAKWGWSLRLKQKKRAIVYLTPCAKYFLAGFALGEKAVQAAQESALPDSVLEVIENAPKYPEGRGVRLEVRTKKDCEAVKLLAGIKMGVS